jgi:carbon monoxide dehydrogenase subunit G
MELNDEIRIAAPREQVYAALNDIAILKETIPGCELLEQESPTNFSGTISAKVGPLKARFSGKAELEDVQPPVSYTLVGEGRGGPAGHAKVRATVTLEEQDQETLMRYAVKADIGGKLAQLGGPLVQRTAQKLAAEFFDNLNKALSVGASAAPAPASEEVRPLPPEGGGLTRWLWATAVAALVAGLWLTR